MAYWGSPFVKLREREVSESSVKTNAPLFHHERSPSHLISESPYEIISWNSQVVFADYPRSFASYIDSESLLLFFFSFRIACSVFDRLAVLWGLFLNHFFWVLTCLWALVIDYILLCRRAVWSNAVGSLEPVEVMQCLSHHYLLRLAVCDIRVAPYWA